MLAVVFAAGCVEAGAGGGDGGGGAPTDGCGNGTIDGGEQCDDGRQRNGTRTSLCTQLCTISTCDDGLEHASEECQPGTPDCTDDCRLIRCGDGRRDDPEECDPPAAFCSSECRILSGCGNGRVEPGEDCEPALDPANCPPSCRFVECGNGRIDPGEECDPQLAPAGCDAACLLLPCGNGRFDPGELCDPGFTPSCAADCASNSCGDGRLDATEECEPSLAPTTCRQDCTELRCGDGHLDAGERCDPAGEPLEALSDCSRGCRWTSCGDGIVGPGEACDGGPDCGTDCASSTCGAVRMVLGWENTLWWTSDGRIVGTGRDDFGQLGGASPGGEITAPRVLDTYAFAKIALAGEFGLGLLADGRMFSWGKSRFGTAGFFDADGASLPPGPLAPHLRFTDVAAELNSSAAIDVDGNLYTWGDSSDARLGGGPAPSVGCAEGRTCRVLPSMVGPIGVRFVDVEARIATFVARDEGGRLWGWGRNQAEQLGPERAGCTGQVCAAPTLLDTPTGTVTAACAGADSIAAIIDGVLWGQGRGRPLGFPDDEGLHRFERIPVPAEAVGVPFVALDCGDFHALAIAADGRVLGFGSNGGEGLLALPDGIDRATAAFIDLPAAARSVGASFRHSAAVLADGSVVTWGGGGNGRLGLGTQDTANHGTLQRVTAVCP